MTRRRNLLVFVLLSVAAWLLLLGLIVAVALIVDLVGWLGLFLGVGTFVALAVVMGSILQEEAPEEPRASQDNVRLLPCSPYDWSRTGDFGGQL